MTVVSVACSDDPKTSADADADASQPTRSFVMAARAEGYDSTAVRPRVASLAALSVPVDGVPTTPVEAVVIPLDLLGIPWDSFSGVDNAPSNLPGAWLDAVNALQTRAEDSGLPVVLALSPVTLAFDGLAPNAKEQGGVLTLDDRWEPYCYDPSTNGSPFKYRDEFAGFAVWASKRFHPVAVIVAQRLNLLETTCQNPSQLASLKGFVAEAARRLRALEVATGEARPVVMASVDVEDLYGFPPKVGRCVTGTPAECLATRKSLVNDLDVDVIGLESYPAVAIGTSGDIPESWLRAAADAMSTEPGKTAILGTGLPAEELDSTEGNVCTPLFVGSPLAQKLWLDQVFSVASLRKIQFVVWRSLTDGADTAVVSACPCPEASAFALCQHLDGFGSGADERRLELVRGLWDSSGTARDAAALWLSTLAGDEK